ncbi:MAG: hypothetical protein AB7O38_21230, partial [Pirellulaceae bacterium]
VPLRFHQAILASPVTLADGTELDTEYQPQGDGYIVWLETSRADYLVDAMYAGLHLLWQSLAAQLGRLGLGQSRASDGAVGDATEVEPPDEESWARLGELWQKAWQVPDYVLTCDLKVPLQASQNEKQLTLSVPNRSTELRLEVSSPHARGRDGGDQRPVTAIPRDGGSTELVHEGVGTVVHLAWREGQELPPVIQADGKITLRPVGRRFDAEALLVVRSFGEPIESFDVRLPAGGLFIPGDRQTAIEVVPAKTSASAGQGTIVTVRRRDGKTTNPIEVPLKVTMGPSDSAVEVSGFEVIGAQIQRGTIEFSLGGDATIDWRPMRNVTRVDVPESLRAQQVAARFEYDQQPFSLLAVPGKAPPRVHVEPTYVVSVEPDRLALEARLRYRIRSAREEKLVLDAAGWELDRVTPPEVLSGAPKIEQGVWEIPLTTSEVLNRAEFELQIQARRAIPPAVAPAEAAAREISFGLPRPRASGLSPAILVVAPADNIELTPLTDRLQALLADTLSPAAKVPVRQQPPLVYREEVGGPFPEFTGAFKVRRQAVSVNAEYLVHVDEREWSSNQRFATRILYEPASRLLFDAPRELVDDGAIESLLDGAPIEWKLAESAEGQVAERRQVVIDLPDRRIGPCEIEFRFRRPHARNLGGTPVAFRVPLVRPIETAEMTSSVIRVRSTEPIRVSLVNDQMQPMEDTSNGATVGDDMTYRTDQVVPPEITLVAITPEAGIGRSTVIERMWVQSLLTSRERRDRACFFLNTTRTQLDVTLPEGVLSTDIHVIVDGQPVKTQPLSPTARQLHVDLGDGLGRRELTLELWYWFRAQPAAIGRLRLDSPQLEEASRPERAYWEIRLPSSEHLVWSSADLVSENAWRWSRLGLLRQPQLTQRELESWVHATTQDEERGFNTYVFSSVGEAPAKIVLTAVRPLAVLVLAGGIFLAGVIWLYWPPIRHPAVLLAVSCLLIGLGIAYPDPAIAAAQGLALGLVLVMIARLLMILWPQRTVARPVSRGSVYGIGDSRSSKTITRRQDSRADAGAAPGASSLEMSVASDEL